MFVFSPRILGEDSHFDEYFSRGLVQPPTSLGISNPAPSPLKTNAFSCCSGERSAWPICGWVNWSFGVGDSSPSGWRVPGRGRWPATAKTTNWAQQNKTWRGEFIHIYIYRGFFVEEMLDWTWEFLMLFKV